MQLEPAQNILFVYSELALLASQVLYVSVLFAIPTYTFCACLNMSRHAQLAYDLIWTLAISETAFGSVSNVHRKT